MSLNQSRFALPVVALFRSRRFCIVALLLAAAAILAPQAVQAASQFWNGGDVANGNWSTTDNWIGGRGRGSTASTTNGDTATFNAPIANTWGNAAVNPVVIDQATQNIGNITFDTNAGSYYIGSTSGNSLLLSSGGTIQITSGLSPANSNTVETINAPLAIQGAGGTYTFTNNSASSAATGGAGSGTLVFAGSIGGGAAGATTLTLQGANLNANTLSGNISNGAATTLGITENGSGVWVLSGNNTYTGNTTLSKGIMDINSTTALGAGTIALNGGAIDNTNGGVTLANNQPVTIGGSFGYNGSNNLNLGTNTVGIGNNQTITLNATGANALTLGALTNTAAATAITLTVNGATNTLNLGSLVLENAGATVETFTIKGGGNVTIAGAVTPGSAGPGSSLTYNSGTATGTGLNVGILTFQGANTYTGLTTISANSIINYQNSTAFGANSAITVASGGIAQVQGSIAGGNLALTLNGAGVTFVGGTLEGALENVSGNNSYSGPIVLSGASAIASDSGLLTLSGSAITGAGNTLTLTGAGSGSISNNIQTTSGGLTKNGPGAWTLSGTANNYTGTTTLNSGNLVSTASGTAIAPFGTGTLTLQSGTLGLAPAGSGTAVTETGGALTYQYGMVTVALNKGTQTSVQFTVPSIARPNPGTMIIAPANGTGGSFNGIVGGGGSGDLGTGENFVSTANSGPVALTNGIVSSTIIAQNNDANLSGDFVTTSATGPCSLILATYNASTNINTAGATAVYNANSSGNGSNTNALAGNAAVYALNTNGQTITASGVQTLTVGNGGAPAGLILNGGGVSGGVLAFGGAEGEIYTSLSGGSISSGITGTNGMETFGPGTLTLSGFNRYTGNTNVLGGTLTLLATGAINNFNNGNSLTVYPGATLNMSANSAYIGVGGMTVDGGTVNVSGAQNYFGTTNIYNGTVNVNSGGALGYTPVNINTNGGGNIKNGVVAALNLNASGAINQNVVTVSSGILTQSASNGLTGTAALAVTGGNGLAVLSQANNFIGNTALSGGVLRLSNANAMQNSILLATGGVLQLRADSSTNFASAANYFGAGVAVDVGQASNSSGQTLTLSGPTYLIANNSAITATGVNLDTLGISSLTLTNPVNATPVGYGNNSIGQISPSTANVTIGAVNTNGYELLLNAPGGSGSSYLPSTVSNITGSGAANIGNWVVAGTSNYQGTTTINGGGVTVVNGSLTSPVINISQGSTIVNGSLNATPGSAGVGTNNLIDTTYFTIGTNSFLINGIPIANPNGTIFLNATLALNNSGAITSGTLFTASASNLTENAANAISGTASLAVNYGGGGVTLSRANNYSGATTIYSGGNGGQGGLYLDFSQPWSPVSNIINSVSSLVLGGAVPQFNGKANTANTQTFNGLTLLSGAAMQAPTLNAGSGGSMLVAVGAITRQVGSAMAFNAATATTGISTTTTNTDFTSTGGQQSIIGGWATVGNSWAISGNSGTNYITALATYTQNTGNALVAGQDMDITATGVTSVPSSIAINSLRFVTGTGASTINATGQTLTIASGGILQGSGTATTITGGTLTSGNNSDLIVTQNSSGTAGIITINSAIANNGSTPIALTLASNLQTVGSASLGGNNTFTGGVYIAGDTQVVLTSPTALGGGQSGTPVYNPLTMGSTVVWNSTLNLNGNSISLASLNTTTAVDIGNLNNDDLIQDANAANATLTIAGGAGASANTVFGGQLKDGTGGGKLALNITGGTLTLATYRDANNYTGGTTIGSGGVLILGDANQTLIGTGTAATSPLVLNGGALQSVVPPQNIKTTTTLTANSTISGPFRITFDSSGTFTNSGGNSTLTSSITNASNAANYILTAQGTGITLNPQLLTIACPVYLSESNSFDRTMTINGTGLTNITGIIHNNSTTDTGVASNLTYNGTGVLELSAVDAFTGNMTINSGAVLLNTLNALQTATVVLNTANGMAFIGNNNYVVGALSGAANEMLLTPYNGSGTVSLTIGNNNAVNPNATYSGILSGPGSLTKNGNTTGTGGMETLSGANTYAGGTTINGGSLQTGANNALGNVAAGLTLANVSSALDLHGYNVTVGVLTASTQSAGLEITNNGSGPSMLTMGYNNQNSNYLDLITDGSGTVGITQFGTGTAVLGANFSQTYSGGTIVTGNYLGGTLKSTLSATGGTPTPFGTGPITINDGTLALAPATAGANIAFGANAAPGTTLTYGGDAIVSLAKGSGTSLTFTIGNASGANLARSYNGQLFVKPSATTTLGSSEFFMVNATGTQPALFTTSGGAPLGGMVNASIVGLGVSTANNGDFLTYTANGFVSDVAAYTTVNATPYTTTGNEIVNVTGNQTVTDGGAGAHAYALLVQSGITATIPSGGTLTIGDNTAGHQAGVILNNGTIGPGLVNGNFTSSGVLNFGAAEGVISAFNNTGTINALISGSGGVTFGGVGGNSTFNLNNYSNNFTGGVTYNAAAGNNNSVLNVGNQQSMSDAAQFGAATNVVTLDGVQLGSGIANGPANVIGPGRSAILGPAGVQINNGLTVAMNMSGPGMLICNAGNGNNLYLSGNNTYTGGTFLEGDDVIIQSDANIGGPASTINFDGGGLSIAGNGMTNLNSHTLNFFAGKTVYFDIQSPSNTFTLSQSLNQAGGGLVKYGAGTLVLTAPETYTGSTQMYGGTLEVDYSQGASLVNGVGANFYGGTLYLKAASTGTTVQTLGTVTLGGGVGNYGTIANGGSLVVDSNTGAGMTVNLGQFNMNTGISNLSTTSFIPYADTEFNIQTTGSGPVTVTTTTNKDSTGIYTGRITMTTASGTDWVTTNSYASPYTLVPYTAYTTVTNPSGSDYNNSLATGNATLAGNWTTNSLKLTPSGAGQALTVGSNLLNVTSGGLLFTGTNAYSISGGTLTSSSLSGASNNSLGANTDATELVIQQYSTSGALTVNSVIANNGVNQTNTNLVKAGPGTLILTGANTYSGFTFINGGVVSVSSDSNLGGANGTLTGVTSVNGNALVSYSGTLPAGFGLGTTFLGSQVSAITAAPGGGYLIALNGTANTTLTGGVASWATGAQAGVYLNGGTLQVTASMSLSESNSGGSAGTSTAVRPMFLGGAGGTIDITNGSVLTIPTVFQSFVYSGGTPAPVALTINSSDNSGGVLNLGYNIGSYGGQGFGGGVNIDGGTLRLYAAYGSNSQGALGYSGVNVVTFNPTFSSGSHPATLQLSGYSETIGGLVSSSTYSVVQNGNGSTVPVTLTVGNGGPETFAGTLQDGAVGAGGSLSISKIGCGTLTLTNTANSYSGATVITSGVLSVNKLANINTNSSIGNGSATGNAADLCLNGGDLQYTGGGDSSNRPFEVTGLGGTIDASGSGPLVLSGTFSSDPPSRVGPINGGTTVFLADVSDLAVGMTVSGTGSSVPSGTTITSIQNGQVGLSKNVAGSPLMTFGYGTTFVPNRTLTLTGSNTGANTISGNLVDPTGASLAVHKTGPGEWVLSGSNTYSGASTVNGGTLAAIAAGALSPSSAFTVNSGALDVTAASQTVSALTIGGAGALNLNDLYPLTVSGIANFALGSTLNVSSSNSSPVTPDLLMTYGVGQQSGSFSSVTFNGSSLPGNDTLYYSSGSLEILTTGPSLWISPVSGNWTPAGNWQGPVPNAIGAGAAFSGTANTALTVTLDAPKTVGTLLFGNTGSTSTAYTLTSSTLTLNNSGSASTATVLSGSQTIASTVQLVGGNLAVALSGSGILNFSGNISDDGSQRSLSLGGDGSGQLVLSGSNSYGGPTNINAGTMYITNTNALPPESNLSVGPGGTFIFDPNGPAPTVATSSAHAASAVEAVPEPGTLALLLVAALWSAAIYRRFSTRKKG